MDGLMAVQPTDCTGPFTRQKFPAGITNIAIRHGRIMVKYYLLFSPGNKNGPLQFRMAMNVPAARMQGAIASLPGGYTNIAYCRPGHL